MSQQGLAVPEIQLQASAVHVTWSSHLNIARQATLAETTATTVLAKV